MPLGASRRKFAGAAGNGNGSATRPQYQKLDSLLGTYHYWQQPLLWMAALTAIVCIMHLMLQEMLHVMAPWFRKLPENSREGRKKTLCVMNIISGLLMLPLMLCYADTFATMRHTDERRWQGWTFDGFFGLVLHCSLSIYEEIIYVYVGRGLEYHLHHFLVLLNFLPCLASQQMLFWAVFDGFVEGTNPFLCLLYLFNDMMLPRNHWAQQINGFFLWLSFTLLRIIMLPIWVYMFLADAWAEDTKHTVGATSSITLYTSLPTTVFLWLLSLAWYKKITAGLLKACRRATYTKLQSEVE